MKAALEHTFSALGDPTRLAIVQRLARGGATVSELAKPFRISLPAISKHLRILEKAGLVLRKKEGRVHHCRLGMAPLEDAQRWIERYTKFWESQLDSLGTYLEQTASTSSDKEDSLCHKPTHRPPSRSQLPSNIPSARKKSSGRGRSRRL